MAWEAWITAALLALMLGALISGRIATDLAVLGALLALLLLGVLEPGEAIGGFASPGLATIAFLYICATGLTETGATSTISARLMGRPKSTLEAQARLILPVTALSAFTNNTTLVAAVLPVLSGAARRAGIVASRLYMPLSFAAILGGICTLIGTSTNLVVAGLIERHNATHPDAQLATFSMFTLTAAGAPVALVGVAYMLVFGRRLLPERREEGPSASSLRQYMSAMRVQGGSPIVGQTIEQAGLRHLPGLFLSRIDRETESVTAVSPTERLRDGDTLVFVGRLESVVDLQKIRGLTPVTDEGELRVGDRPTRRLAEAVISSASPLIGQTIRDAGIRTRYGAVVVAVHRHGHRLSGKIGDITIRQGDTLLLEAGSEFARRYRNSIDFHLVSELDGAAAPRHDKAPIAVAILVALIAALSLNLTDPMTGSMAAAALMVLTRCCTAGQARRGMDWQVLIVVGASFGLGRAIEKSGLGEVAAGEVVRLAEWGGPVAILACVYAMTTIFTMFVSNVAAAVMMFPVALEVARTQGIAFLPLAVCIAIGASAEFTTPLGYQTNLMVMGPGGYRWSDFLRFGGPLTLLCGAVCVAAAAVVYGPLTIP